MLSDPDDTKQRRALGVGTKAFSDEDIKYLLKLRKRNPSRSLRDYQRCLQAKSGKKVDKSAICKLFLKAFPVRASLRKTNPIPINKFKPAHIEKFEDYVATINGIDPMRLKFADEKLLKGLELFGLRARPDPYTGKMPGKIV